MPISRRVFQEGATGRTNASRLCGAHELHESAWSTREAYNAVRLYPGVRSAPNVRKCPSRTLGDLAGDDCFGEPRKRSRQTGECGVDDAELSREALGGPGHRRFV